jgi:hypothetical protein
MSGFCADALPVSRANAPASNKILLHPDCLSFFGVTSINYLPYTDGAALFFGTLISRIYPIGATFSIDQGGRKRRRSFI